MDESLFDDFNFLIDGWNIFLDGPGSGSEGGIGSGGTFPGGIGGGIPGYEGGVGSGGTFPGGIGGGIPGYEGGIGSGGTFPGGIGGGIPGYEGWIGSGYDVWGGIGSGYDSLGGVNDPTDPLNLWGGIGDGNLYSGGIGDGGSFAGGIGDPDYGLDLPVGGDDDDTSRFGAKIWLYDPHTDETIDLSDGIGDLGRGFGDPLNRYPWSMEVFGDSVYVGTLNGNPTGNDLLHSLALGADEVPTLYSTGPQIYRWTMDVPGDDPTPDGGTWERVLEQSDLASLGLSDQVGIREMLGYDGYLYATSSNNLAPGLLQGSQDQAVMIRSMDGSTWEQVTGGPFNNPLNSSVRTMSEIDGYLYVGTDSNKALLGTPGASPELWKFDGHSWTELGNGGTVPGSAISEVISFDGDIFFGNWGALGGYSLYMVDDFGDFQDVTPTSFHYVGGETVPDYVIGSPETSEPLEEDDFVLGGTSPYDDLGIIKLFTYDDYLYAGTIDWIDGTTFMRTDDPLDPDSWQLMTADGFYSELGPGAVNAPDGISFLENGNFYIWSAEVFENSADTLYVGTFNGTDGSGQLLKQMPTDGPGDLVQFEMVTQDAFGANGIYGFRSMEQMDDYLVLGGASSIAAPDFNSAPYDPFVPDAFYNNPLDDLFIM